MTSKITRRRIEITVPHSGKDLVFVYPAFGRSTYAIVGRDIEQGGLRNPILAETTSLLLPIFDEKDDNYNSPESAQIRKIMFDNWLWGFTGSQFLPKKDNWKLNNGVYVQDDPETKDGMPYMDRQSLQDALEIGATEDQYGIIWSADNKVRFVPYDRFTLGEKSPSRLAKDPYIIALERGEEGADKLARIADARAYQLQPRIRGLKDVKIPKTRVSALLSYGKLDERRLDVDGRSIGGWGGCAFGVSEETSEARAPN